MFTRVWSRPVPPRPAPHQPRKTPRQQRAWQTRRRILDAAARVFAEYGHAAGTTDRIAAEARLSVGSLYQYFPNKDSILLTLALEHVDETAQAVRVSLAGLPDGPVPVDRWLPAVVGACAELHTRDPRLHRVLFEESPRPPDLLARFHEAEREAAAAVESLLRRDPDLTPADPERSARVVVAVVESLVHRFVAQQPDRISEPELTGEIVAVVTGYLGRATVS
ncbi:TetR/AcrR family transcriptional regulator [Verrucosispora sp. SN26_14.1]|nr:TetR/AcrR family transcriptional regulator [Verrucosispora sp. SN26_14.1]